MDDACYTKRIFINITMLYTNKIYQELTALGGELSAYFTRFAK